MSDQATRDEIRQPDPPPDVWLWSTDEENWSCCDEFDSRKAAIEDACAELQEEGRCFWTGKKAEVGIATFDGDDACEHMGGNACDQVGEHAEGWPEATKAQREELGEELRRVTLAWLDRHGLMPGFFKIDDVEEHHVPHAEEVVEGGDLGGGA